MSVILFDKSAVFQKMADAYEGLKSPMRRLSCMSFTAEDDYQFYTSLRRLYFANVATYLCQYHDATPAQPPIDPFTSLVGKPDMDATFERKVATFISNWKSLQYNLTTNDGEAYQAVEAYQYMQQLATRYMEAVVRKVGEPRVSG